MTGRPCPRDVISRFGDRVCNLLLPDFFWLFPLVAVCQYQGGLEYTGLVLVFSPVFLPVRRGNLGTGSSFLSGGMFHSSPWPGHQVLRLEEGGNGVGS